MRPEVNAYAMRQGLALGCLFAVNFVSSTIPSIAFFTWFVEGLILWCVYRSGVRCRDNIMEGEMSYGAALWFIVQLFLYSSMVAGVFKYVYLKWIHPEYLTELSGAMKEVMQQMKMPMDDSVAVVNDILTPENMAIYSVGGDVMLGLIVGLVMAFVLKRTKD